jgi:hypothetical protein
VLVIWGFSVLGIAPVKSNQRRIITQIALTISLGIVAGVPESDVSGGYSARGYRG